MIPQCGVKYIAAENKATSFAYALWLGSPLFVANKREEELPASIADLGMVSQAGNAADRVLELDPTHHRALALKQRSASRKGKVAR